jgi:hypothetical protein
MVAKSPGLIEVAGDYVKKSFEWAVSNPLYPSYFIIFVCFGTAGVWFDFAFPVTGTERKHIFEYLGFTPLITFSAPIIVAIIAKNILIGLSKTPSNYPIKTLHSFCFFYFLIVVILFVAGYSSGGGKMSGFSIVAVILLLIFQFFYGANDDGYEDVDLDVSARSASDDRDALNGVGL